ncbi:MAG: HPF/RaiA family ribosome-associated protein [Steroidobacteraceae bacterium]
MPSLPLTLTFHHIDRSGALEERARKLGARLQRFSDRIMQCHMVFEGPDGRRDGGAPFCVKIELSVPGAHIHADSLRADGRGHEDIYLALRDAFNNAKRQLQGLHRDRSAHFSAA